MILKPLPVSSSQPKAVAPPLVFRDCDLAALGRVAAALAAIARAGDVIALEGDLGAGKTAFARAFIRAAHGFEVEVPSPTFNIVLTYAAPPGTIWHFDLYRLRAPEELFELGLEDAFTAGISLIEWPDRLGDALPNDALTVTLTVGERPDTRHLSLTYAPEGRDWQARLNTLAKRP